MVKITFVWHDCFVVETAGANFVFDYWMDSDGTFRGLPGAVAALDRDKPLYVLVSHGHKDHFNRQIFGWAELFDDIHYLVSNDVMKRIRHIVSETSVYAGPKVSRSQVTVLRPGEEYSCRGVTVRAFPSTDIGNSYMVEACGIRIFHAGDLNAWIWLDDSTDAEVRKAMGDYKACLRDIAAWLDARAAERPGARRTVDYCFFPVDSRIGREYYTGARMFVREFNVARFFPMHFDLGEADERAARRKDALDFSLYANTERGEYIPLALHGASYLDA